MAEVPNAPLLSAGAEDAGNMKSIGLKFETRTMEKEMAKNPAGKDLKIPS